MRPRLLSLSSVLWIAVSVSPALPSRGDEPAWTRSPWFEELYFKVVDERKLRFHVNAPADEEGKPTRATRLIVYALPNGNTIEQTLGCKLTERLDWHYDIQHVAAQLRLLRTLAPHERIVLVCTEAAGLSWPNWRRDQPQANATIGRLVDEWRNEFGADGAKVTLTGHSGGGSFMFGVIDAAETIPEYIDRIAFLDANYAFDAAKHADKLRQWLVRDNSHRLIVLAYDDREITLDGKKVVGPTGGTFRATQRMHNSLAAKFSLVNSERPPFRETIGLDGRIHFYVHLNPENKILHTALVGDMNGLVHVQTLGTSLEETWGTFGGPRAYAEWIQREPSFPPRSADESGKGFSRLPARPADAIGGRAFAQSLQDMGLEQREAAILREITRGNFPEFLRNFKPIQISGTIRAAASPQRQRGELDKQVTTTLHVMPDYLAIGGDADFVRMPMTPQTAQQIADRFGCILPTRKIVDAIDQHAEVRLAPHPLTNEREAVATFLQHHDIIERQRGGSPLGQLVAGIKKDIVLSPRIFERPQRLAIYGWRQLDGQPIQPLTIVHWNRYVDYSHGVRLVRNSIELDGKTVKITELLPDSNRCGLISDEGPMNPPAYPVD